jgi:hypothetical protein
MFKDIARSDAIAGPFVDRRDFSFIPSFENPSVELFAQHLEAGPKPKVYSIALLIDQVF